MSKIEWTDRVWNPVTGCTKVSQGCKHCYAERMAKRLAGRAGYPADDPFRVTLRPDRLQEPLGWRKPSMVFVNSMSDLFHEDVPFDFIDKVFAIMAENQTHTFQILTKRPERMAEYFACVDDLWAERWPEASEKLLGDCEPYPFPLPNVWLGTSIEDQKTADERIPHLLRTPAAVRFVSAEPLLGPVSFRWMSGIFPEPHTAQNPSGTTSEHEALRRIDWLICGGESGPGARPMHPDWARSLRDQCQAAGVPFFFKQWGEWEVATDENGRRHGYSGHCMPDTGERFTWLGADGTTSNPSATQLHNAYAMAKVGKKAAGRLLDGREWNEIPEIQA